MNARKRFQAWLSLCTIVPPNLSRFPTAFYRYYPYASASIEDSHAEVNFILWELRRDEQLAHVPA